jgi:hypothetical protein
MNIATTTRTSEQNIIRLSSLRVFPPMFLYIQFNMTMQCSAVLVIVSIYQYAMLFRCSRRLNPPIRYSCPKFLLWFKFLDVALSNHQLEVTFRFNFVLMLALLRFEPLGMCRCNMFENDCIWQSH